MQAQIDPHPDQFKFVFFKNGKKINSQLSHCPLEKMPENIDNVREWLIKNIDHNPGFLCWGPDTHKVNSLAALKARLEELQKKSAEVPV